MNDSTVSIPGLLGNSPLLLACVLLVCSICTTNNALAQYTADARGLVIVMHPDVDIQSIDDQELMRLFIGKSRRLPNGARAALASFSPESSFFNEKLLNLSDARVASLWSRLRFSGRTPPPRVFHTVEALVRYVSTTPNALAYMPASASRENVRVVGNLPR